MKILWCFVFSLVFNNFQTIVSKLINENEEINSVQNLMQKIEVLHKLFERSNKACFEQNQQRLEALEKLFLTNLQSQEQNFGRIDTALEKNEQIQDTKIGALKTVLEINNKRIGALEKLHERDDECASCLAESNTVCDESRIPPVCTCAQNHLPVDGEATNGCKDPCLDFNDDNAECDRVDHETRNCSCNAGYHPVNGDPCNGCNDECASCLAESNTVCDESRIPPVCTCAENHLPVDGEATNGCKDPCLDFNEDNAVCDRVDHETQNCSCKAGYHPVNGNACNGCNDPCDDFGERNSLCTAIDAIRFNCSCEQGFVPVHDNEPCQGCKKIVCPSSLGYKNYGDFGCLKAHKTRKNWKDARATCKNEGGDLFIPGDELPLLPKDEMNLEIWNYYSIGIRSNGRNGPFERINSGAKLDDDSKLWRSVNPHRQGQECVVYHSGDGLLWDTYCTNSRSYYFICGMK